MTQKPEEKDGPPLVEIARYPSLNAARQSSLALAAKAIPYLIKRDGSEWKVSVDEHLREAAIAEVQAFEAEERRRPAPSQVRPLGKIRPLSLFLAGWFLSACFIVQEQFAPGWMDRGESSSQAIMAHGEWWRIFTALTLHADGTHLAANLATGLLFAAFLLPQLGTGLTWLLIVISGALGNAINAWTYRSEPHLSIGASTSVFGALGLLVAMELWARWESPASRGRWQLIVPIGAGLSLLAYLGVGGKHDQVDFMAHLWGFASGLALGLPAAALQLSQRTPRWIQAIAATASAAAIVGSWIIAWQAG